MTVYGAQRNGGPTVIAACTAEVRTRRARVLAGRISVRLSCPSGCSGGAFDADDQFARRLRAFSFESGTHTLRLTLSSRARRRARLRLRLAIDAGPVSSAEIRLRR